MTVTLPGWARDDIGDAVLDRAVGLDKLAREKRKNSAERIRLEKLAGDMRKIANEIMG